MPDLITTSRAIQNATLAALNASNTAYLASLISAASDVICRKCGRDFVQTSYSEYLSGGSYVREPLRLRQFPVLEISRVAGRPTAALVVVNTDPATNQRATVEITAAGLTLTRVASGTPTSVSLASATYATVGAMASAIIALGGGWSATVQSQPTTGDFSKWPSSDFKPLQGAASAFNGGAGLEIYTEDIQGLSAGVGFSAMDVDDGGWSGTWSGARWRLDDETGELFGRFPRGKLNLRVDYTAGFATVPAAIQEAATQLAADLYQASLVNNTLKKATLGAASFELKSTSASTQVSGKVSALIAPYIDHAKRVGR